MKWPWTKRRKLIEGETVTLQVHNGMLIPIWWDFAKHDGISGSDFECGYDAGFIDGIQLRYRAEQEGKMPRAQ